MRPYTLGHVHGYNAHGHGENRTLVLARRCRTRAILSRHAVCICAWSSGGLVRPFRLGRDKARGGGRVKTYRILRAKQMSSSCLQC
jgi:hypothetical protein